MGPEIITGWTWDEKPPLYGWFNLMWYGIMIAGCVFFYFQARKHDSKLDNKICFIFGVSLMALEVYKEVLFAIDEGGYNWGLFPFQFCSVPMYISFLAPLMKKEKIKEAMFKFLALFGFLAGIATMSYPQGLLDWDFITITCHSFIWHTSMVWIGFYLIISKGYCKQVKSLFKEVNPGVYVFVSILVLAILMNIFAYNVYFFRFTENAGSFNMFYISPYYGCSLPILHDIRATGIPYPLFVFIYVLAFALGISALWFIIYGIRKLITKISLTNNKKVKAGV